MAPLDPPPEDLYDSIEVAEANVQQWAEAHGYATVRKTSTKDAYSEMRKIWLICDKGGKIRSIRSLVPASGEQRQGDTRLETKPRKAGSRKTGCQFELTITRIPEEQWKVAIISPTHNHEPSLNASAHPAHRKLTTKEENAVNAMIERLEKPREILFALQQADSHTHITARDIRNKKAKVRKEELAGRTATEAILDQLMTSTEWATSYTKDPHTNRVNTLLFCHHKGIELAQNRPEVLLINATYKTNQYNMPLLHFAGVYSTNARKGRTFSIGFCFLPDENEMTYRWAISESRRWYMVTSIPLSSLLPIMMTVYAMPYHEPGPTSRLSSAGGILVRISL